MATRQEIELLIKLRSEADAALARLATGIRSVGAETTRASAGVDKLDRETKTLGASGVAAGVVLGQLATTVASKLAAAFTATIREADRLDAGLIGLSTVAGAFRQSAEEAREAAVRLSSDGLMTVGEAATGLKNLLASGFSLDQAVRLMEAFKDSAAFGRQSALTFGEAVASATEGIKNGNSILVDNAGVTKNLSVILQEAGFAATDLMRATTDANVRMALFNGILKETRPQLGDAARLLETAAGKQQQFTAQVLIAQQQVGKALQPALKAALSALTPLVELVAKAPQLFVGLGGAIAAAVVPIVSLRTASALGLTSLLNLGGAAGQLGSALKAASLSAAASDLGSLAAASGRAATALGALQIAALGVGAALAGWQIGQWINQLTGADAALARFIDRFRSVSLASETAAAQQDVITRAIRQGSEATISYAEAVQYNADKEAIRIAQFDRSAEAERRAIEARVRLGELTRAEADDLLVSVAAEERRIAVQERRASLASALAEAEQRVRAEIEATGLTLPELTSALAKNEAGFRQWAEANALSKEAVDLVEASLKRHEEAQKRAKQAAERHREEVAKQREALEQLGILTLPRVQERVAELNALVEQARADHADLAPVVRALWPEYEKLAAQARASGQGLAIVTAALTEQLEAAGLVLKGTRDLSVALSGLAAPTASVSAATQELITAAHADVEAERQRAEAYEFFGLKTRDELQRTAQEAVAHYERIRSDGTATPAQIQEAFKRASEAVRAASGEIPSYWSTTVLPSLTGTVETLQSAISGSFAQMLLGAKSFGEGFVDIWKSIKAAVLNIFNELANAFIRDVLTRILGALSGGRAGIAGGFGDWLKGLFGGGTGGRAALPGLATAGAALPGVPIPPELLPGAGGAAAGGLGALGGLLGGLGAGAGGLLLGRYLSQFGKVAGLGGGAAGGAATGALIGSILPGLGTGIGALVGGLGGLLGGLFGGPSRAEQEGRQLAARFRQGLLQELTPRQMAEVQQAIQGAWKGNEVGAATVIAIRDAYLATGRSAEAALAVADRLWRAEKEGGAAVAQVIAEIAGVFAEVQAEMDRSGLSFEELRARALGAGQAGTESAAHIEAAWQAAGRTIEDERAAYERWRETSGRVKADVTDAADAIAAAVDAAGERVHHSREAWETWRERGGVVGRELAVEIASVGEAAQRAASEIGRAFEGIRVPPIEVPYRYRQEGEGLPGDVGPDLPGAQHGLFATRPTLRWFAEGGEPELGGPIGFMTEVLAGALARVLPTDQRRPEPPLVLSFQVSTVNPDGLRAAVERDIVPILVDVVRGNRRQARTDLRAALGVT